ncbi:MAG: sulfatase-like hydrolase/transferase, partial [Ruegeria sp.]
MSRKTRNILFIMFDQLRYDYLSCAGHPYLHTPHLDALAARGVRFSHCYVQSPICGASRMSFYTGRYVHSHGAAWNNFPLKVGEVTLGDHLRERGMDSWLIGKTHMRVDQAGMDRLGISRDGIIGARVAECGFDVFLRDDGLWGEGPAGFYDKKRSPYNEYLKGKGYEAENPWQHNANAALDEDGNVASGWFMRNADKPADIAEEDSETPWLTGQAIEFISQQDAKGAGPWMCHLSYIKPHWPYIVPAPYHDMYGANQILPLVRSEGELVDTHPVYEQFMHSGIDRTFSKPGVREK